MTIRSTALFMAALLCGSAGAAEAQTRPTVPAPSPPDPMPEIARLYDSLSARPGWPAVSNEAEVDATLARRGLRPEQRRSIIGLMRQDVCRPPEMAPVCRYYGAETIYKVQRLGWAQRAREAGPAPGRPTEEQGTDTMIQQMRLLEHGATRSLGRLYAEDGMTDAEEAQLDNATVRTAAGPSTQLSVWFHCSKDIRSLAVTGGPWDQYKLTTCGTGIGFIFRIAIFGWKFAFESDLLLTHSRFARRVLGVWWVTGSEPNICANSIIDGSGNQQCNSNRWFSPVSFNFGTTFNPPASVVSTGTGARLNQPFAVTIVHQ